MNRELNIGSSRYNDRAGREDSRSERILRCRDPCTGWASVVTSQADGKRRGARVIREVLEMPQTNAATVRRLYQDWNKRDFDHLSSLYARTGEIVLVGSGTRFQGPEGAKEHATMWATASRTARSRSTR
jgi:hypothetical protein